MDDTIKRQIIKTGQCIVKPIMKDIWKRDSLTDKQITNRLNHIDMILKCITNDGSDIRGNCY